MPGLLDPRYGAALTANERDAFTRNMPSSGLVGGMDARMLQAIINARAAHAGQAVTAAEQQQAPQLPNPVQDMFMEYLMRRPIPFTPAPWTTGVRG